MKTGVAFYESNWAYRVMKRLAAKKCGKDAAQAIWQDAGDRFDALLQEHANVPDGHKEHLHESILPRVAMYRALQEFLTQEEALQVIDQTLRTSAAKFMKAVGWMAYLPGVPKLFMKKFSSEVKESFGPAAGFKQEFYEDTPSKLRFDITQCPYCNACTELGCPELTRTFCDSDVYVYGNIPKIVFARTQTLGTGGSCCDFDLRRE